MADRRAVAEVQRIRSRGAVYHTVHRTAAVEQEAVVAQAAGQVFDGRARGCDLVGAIGDKQPVVVQVELDGCQDRVHGNDIIAVEGNGILTGIVVFKDLVAAPSIVINVGIFAQAAVQGVVAAIARDDVVGAVACQFIIARAAQDVLDVH